MGIERRDALLDYWMEYKFILFSFFFFSSWHLRTLDLGAYQYFVLPCNVAGLDSSTRESCIARKHQRRVHY